MKVLLTGFGPFGDVKDNPSGRIAHAFRDSGFGAHELRTEALPVSFSRAEETLRALLRKGEFDVALLTGVASGSRRFRLEAVAANEDAARIPDCDGFSPQSSPIVEGGDPVLRTPFDVEAICTALCGRGHDIGVSEDAGRYVCNHAYYAALHEAAAAGLSTRCLFLHVPPDPATFGEAREDEVPFERHIALTHDLLVLLVR